MRTTRRRVGNSQGVIIPKPLLSQLDFTGEVEMVVERDAIVLRKPHRNARRGWAETNKALASASEDGLVWPEFGNVGDDELTW